MILEPWPGVRIGDEIMPNRLGFLVLRFGLAAVLTAQCSCPLWGEPADTPAPPATETGTELASPPEGPWKVLLQSAWETSASGRELLDRLHTEIQQRTPSRELSDAYLLGLLKQNRYDDALQLLSAWRSKSGTGDKPVLDVYRGRTHVWVVTALRQFDAAFVLMAELLAGLPDEPWEKWSPAERGLISFAGRITGFLLEPVQTPPLQRSYDDTIVPLVTSMPQAAQERFHRAREEVQQQFQSLRDEVDQLRQIEKQKQEEAKAQEKERLEKESSDLDRRQEELDREQQSLREQLREQLHTLSQQDSALALRLQDIGMTSDILFDSVIRGEIGLAALIELYENEESDALALWWLSQIDTLDIRQSRELRALRGADRAARITQLQRGQAQREAVAASRSAQGQSQQINSERARMVEWQRKLAQKKRKLERPTNTISRELRQKQQQMRALNTYEPYPLEAVRAFLLKQTE